MELQSHGSLAGVTEGFVGSDLEALCRREAGMLALREGVTIVARRHFDAAKMKVHPTMNENLSGNITARSSSTSRAGFRRKCSRRSISNFFLKKISGAASRRLT